MTDQCINCTLRGSLRNCLASDCYKHEDWYAVEQQKRIDELEQKLAIAESLISFELMSELEDRYKELLSS